MGYCEGTKKDTDARGERRLLPQWRNKPTWTKNTTGEGRRREWPTIFKTAQRNGKKTSLLGIWFAKGWGWEFAHNYALMVLSTPSAFHPPVHAKRPSSPHS